MVTEIYRVNNVNCQHHGEYFLFNGLLIYQEKHTNDVILYSIDKGELLNRLSFDGKIEQFKVCNNNLYFNDEKSRLFQLKEEKIICLVYTNKVYLNPKEKSEYSFSKFRDKSGNIGYYAFSLKSLEFKFELDPDIRFIEANWFFKYKENKITSFEFNGHVLLKKWVFDLNELPTINNNIDREDINDSIERWIGVKGNMLFVTLKSSKLLILNISTGSIEEIIFHTINLGRLYSKDLNEIQFSPFGYSNLDDSSNKLIAIYGQSIFELVLSDIRVKIIHDLSNKLSDFQPFKFDYNNIGDLPFNEDFILGIDKMEGKLIVWDRKKNEIIVRKDRIRQDSKNNVQILNSSLNGKYFCLGLPNSVICLFSIRVKN